MIDAQNSNAPLKWINIGKGIAMIAVIVDHLHFLVYSNPIIWNLSFFSVTVFVFLSGVTSSLSMEKRNIDCYNWKYIGQRLASILVPYAFATFVCILYFNHFFDIKIFLVSLATFSAQPPYYFIAFFLQLVLISPLLFLTIKLMGRSRHKNIYYCVFMVLICIISYLCIRYTFILPLHGGGKYLFGGSYLFIFALGMLLAHIKPALPKKKLGVPAIIISSLALLLCAIFFISFPTKEILLLDSISSDMIFNPPGIRLIVYALLIVLVLWISQVQLSSQKMVRILAPIELCGKHSLIIFIYHRLVIDLFEKLHPILPAELASNVVYRVVVFIAVLAVPIIINILYKKAKTYLISETRLLNQ